MKEEEKRREKGSGEGEKGRGEVEESILCLLSNLSGEDTMSDIQLTFSPDI